MAWTFPSVCSQPCTAQRLLEASLWTPPIGSSYSRSQKSIQVHIQLPFIFNPFNVFLHPFVVHGTYQGEADANFCKASSPSHCRTSTSPGYVGMDGGEERWTWSDITDFYGAPVAFSLPTGANLAFPWVARFSLVIFQDVHKWEHPTA